MTLEEIRQRLDELSAEMTALIRQYELSAAGPLEVMENARRFITSKDDYIRFLEISLEGRILADEGGRLAKVHSMLQ